MARATIGSAGLPFPTPTPPASQPTPYLDELKREKTLLDQIGNSREALALAVQSKELIAAPARTDLSATDVSQLSVDDVQHVNALFAEINAATTQAQALAALNKFKTNLRSNASISYASIPTHIVDAIAALSKPTIAPNDPTLVVADITDAKAKLASSTSTDAFDIALNNALISSVDRIVAIREELAAKEMHDAAAGATYIAQEDKVKAASVNAYIETALALKTDVEVLKARKVYDELAMLRTLWGINPDITVLDPTKTDDYNVTSTYTYANRSIFKPTNADVTLIGPSGKGVKVKEKSVDLYGDMTIDELKEVLKYSHAQWGKDGLKINVYDKEFAARIAAAAELLAEEQADDDKKKAFTKYTIKVDGFHIRGNTFYGEAAREVAKKGKHISEGRLKKLYAQQKASASTATIADPNPYKPLSQKPNINAGNIPRAKAAALQAATTDIQQFLTQAQAAYPELFVGINPADFELKTIDQAIIADWVRKVGSDAREYDVTTPAGIEKRHGFKWDAGRVGADGKYIVGMSEKKDDGSTYTEEYAVTTPDAIGIALTHKGATNPGVVAMLVGKLSFDNRTGETRMEAHFCEAVPEDKNVFKENMFKGKADALAKGLVSLCLEAYKVRLAQSLKQAGITIHKSMVVDPVNAGLQEFYKTLGYRMPGGTLEDAKRLSPSSNMQFGAMPQRIDDLQAKLQDSATGLLPKRITDLAAAKASATATPVP